MENINGNEEHNMEKSLEKKEEKKDKEYILIVNTREKIWDKKEITYKEVIVLAYSSYSEDPNVIYTITYSKGEGAHHHGTMVLGDSVKVKNGMVFNVTQSNKS